MELVSLKECPTPEDLQLCETPDRAAGYWREHIDTHPFFNPECECLVVVMLNTRSSHQRALLRIHRRLGRILVHPREVFRAAVIVGAASITQCVSTIQ